MGDVLIVVGLSGLYFNGYLLVCKILEVFKVDKNEWLVGKIIGEYLFVLIKIYIKFGLKLIVEYDIYVILYIIGGGFWENILCVLLEGIKVVIDGKSWEWLVIF